MCYVYLTTENVTGYITGNISETDKEMRKEGKTR